MIIYLIINNLMRMDVRDSVKLKAVQAQRQPLSTPNNHARRRPILARPSSLARRFQQICAAAMAQCLAGRAPTPLQYAAFPFLRDEPGLDQIGLAARIGIDRTNVGLLSITSRRVVSSNAASIATIAARGGCT